MLVAMHPLFDNRVVFVSGKGGVGKTTVAAALARLAAREGKRVCLVEIEAAESFERLMGVRVGHDPRLLAEVGDGTIDGLNIDPEEMLREFLAHQIKVKALYSRLFRASVYRYFVAAAPGLQEVMALGKIYLLAHERVGKGRAERPRYDLIVVDAPASGHGVALLRVPRLIGASVRRGPVKYYADKLVAFLADPAQVALAIVTLAEEMPVTEALEMERQIRADLPVHLGPIVVNDLWPERFGAEELGRLGADAEFARAVEAAIGDPRAHAAAARAMAVSVRNLAGARPHLEKLRAETQCETLEIPHVFARDRGWDFIDAVADGLGASLAASPASARPVDGSP